MKFIGRIVLIVTAFFIFVSGIYGMLVAIQAQDFFMVAICALEICAGVWGIVGAKHHAGKCLLAAIVLYGIILLGLGIDRNSNFKDILELTTKAIVPTLFLIASILNYIWYRK